VRSYIVSAMAVLTLLGVCLCACAESTGGRQWNDPGYYPGGYSGRSAYGGYYGGYYPGPGYYRDYRADRYRALPPQGPHYWAQRPEHRAAPRTENWSQERLRQHWEQLKQRDCAAAGARC
jgi:hypothetical protein